MDKQDNISNIKQPNKYSKIQPNLNIKPKPKPIPIAVLPKPSKTERSNFNPNLNTTSKLKSDIALNINTSKKWVLPPRPRPGRKPVNNDDDKSSSTTALNTPDPTSSTDNGNKSFKVDSKQEGSHTQHQTSVANSSSFTPSTNGKKKSTKKDKELKTKDTEKGHEKSLLNQLNKQFPSQKDTPETIDLKKTYLNKLRENALIYNYIEVLNNQIKQLNFIKNGYMTLDTLNEINIAKHNDFDGLNISSNVVDQNRNSKEKMTLDKVHNIQDLDRFLNYLNKSSSLIHSAIKRGPEDDDIFIDDNDNLNNQINKYLSLKSSFKNSTTGQTKSKLKAQPHNKPNKRDYKSLNRNLLTENNLFDRLIINDDNDNNDADDNTKFVKKTCSCGSSKIPCFCLDGDKR